MTDQRPGGLASHSAFGSTIELSDPAQRRAFLDPSNILVGLYDGRAVPKVIDFGVAKATGTKLSEHSVYTEVGQIVGTLEYMSPEQAELNNLDIDTRTDVKANRSCARN